jgi:hypothetical protein
MVRSPVCRALSLAIAIVALAAAPRHAAPQEATTPAGRERHLLGEIQDIVARDGLNAARLLEPLTALILFYQEQDDESAAAVTIERARHVVRVNNGLHTLEQVPLIEQLMRIEEARGNHTAAWDLEQDLLRLVRRYPEDLRTVPVLREAAERQMEVLARYLDGEKPPQLYLGCYYNEWRSHDSERKCDSGSRKTVLRGMVADAQRSYAEAIAVLLRHELYDSAELRDLEVALLRGVDLVRTPDYEVQALEAGGNPMLEPWRSRAAPIVELARWDLPYFGSSSPAAAEARRHEIKRYHISNTYFRGRQGLQRLYAYDVAVARPLVRQAEGLVQLADWELLHANHGHAVDTYGLVRAALQRAGVAAASIDRLFLPDVPVVLPAFQPNPLAPAPNKESKGHIDVVFEISKYGRGRDVELVGAENTTKAEQDKLVRLISHSRFRPRPTGGEFDGSSRVSLRYYLY